MYAIHYFVCLRKFCCYMLSTKEMLMELNSTKTRNDITRNGITLWIGLRIKMSVHDH